jgi:hypothetical protein
LGWLRVGGPVLSREVFEEADADLVSLTVTVGADAPADLLALNCGGLDSCAKMLVWLYVCWAVYDSGVIVRRWINQVVKFPAIRVDHRNIR